MGITFPDFRPTGASLVSQDCCKWQKMSQWALPPARYSWTELTCSHRLVCVSSWFSRTLTISPTSWGSTLLSIPVFQLRGLSIQRTNTCAVKDWGKEHIVHRNNLNTSVLSCVMGEFIPDWMWSTLKKKRVEITPWCVTQTHLVVWLNLYFLCQLLRHKWRRMKDAIIYLVRMLTFQL